MLSFLFKLQLHRFLRAAGLVWKAEGLDDRWNLVCNYILSLSHPHTQWLTGLSQSLVAWRQHRSSNKQRLSGLHHTLGPSRLHNVARGQRTSHSCGSTPENSLAQEHCSYDAHAITSMHIIIQSKQLHKLIKIINMFWSWASEDLQPPSILYYTCSVNAQTSQRFVWLILRRFKLLP